MGKVILQTLQASDSQKTYSDKSNYNFHLLADYINGVKTVKGDKGDVGMPGATGRQGIQGERGNSVFVYDKPFPKDSEDIKKEYISWCEEKGITENDSVIFCDVQAIYRSGVNNDDKVPHEGKIEDGGDLVIDLSGIIQEFIDKKEENSTFWSAIGTTDYITLKNLLGTDKAGKECSVVLADMTKDNNLPDNINSNLSKSYLNIFSDSTAADMSDIRSIYSVNSGISLNSLYSLDTSESTLVENRGREFRITQRSIRKDSNNEGGKNFAEGLFIIAPLAYNSENDDYSSGFRFITKKDGSKINNIITIGDGEYTKKSLLDEYKDTNVENAITFARGEVRPLTDSQYGGYFSIGVKYDDEKTQRGFIQIIGSVLENESGSLDIGGNDTYLNLSYDSNKNLIYSKENLEIKSDKNLNIESNALFSLFSNCEGREIIGLFTERNSTSSIIDTIKLVNESGSISIKNSDISLETLTTILMCNKNGNDELNYIRIGKVKPKTSEGLYLGSNRVISQEVVNTNFRICEDYFSSKISVNPNNKDKNDSFKIINNLVDFVSIAHRNLNMYSYNSVIYSGAECLVQPIRESEYNDPKFGSLDIITVDKRVEIYNVLGRDGLSLMFPHFREANKEGEEQDVGGSLQFKVPIVPENIDNFWEYGSSWTNGEKWNSGYIGRVGPYNISGKEFKPVYLNGSGKNINILPKGSYGIAVQSSTDLKLTAGGKVSIVGNTIDIGDANSVVNIAGKTENCYYLKKDKNRYHLQENCVSYDSDSDFLLFKDNGGGTDKINEINGIIKAPTLKYNNNEINVGFDYNWLSLNSQRKNSSGGRCYTAVLIGFMYNIGLSNFNKTINGPQDSYDLEGTASLNYCHAYYNNTTSDERYTVPQIRYVKMNQNNDLEYLLTPTMDITVPPGYLLLIFLMNHARILDKGDWMNLHATVCNIKITGE